MSDDAQNDINNVTSGKGNVNSTTGIVVLASNQTTERYWHYFNALGGGGGNATPVCRNRTLPVAQDSAGGDVAPSCTDSDGPSALTYAISAQGTKGVASVNGNQLHYTPNGGQSGADTFSYTAFDGAATSAPATVNVTITPSGGGTPATVSPVADTYVASDLPTVSNGTSTTLRTRTSSTAQLNSYLRFTFSGVGTASGATLRLFVNDGGVDAGKLYQVLDDSWSESMLYADQPALGPLIVDLGAVTAGAYRDIDVSSYVTADGTYSFAIIGEVNDPARFDSREAANDPLLVVTP
jgi:hypothetical protein